MGGSGVKVNDAVEVISRVGEMFVVINIVVDVLYTVVDPRVN